MENIVATSFLAMFEWVDPVALNISMAPKSNPLRFLGNKDETFIAWEMLRSRSLIATVVIWDNVAKQFALSTFNQTLSIEFID